MTNYFLIQVLCQKICLDYFLRLAMILCFATIVVADAVLGGTWSHFIDFFCRIYRPLDFIKYCDQHLDGSSTISQVIRGAFTTIYRLVLSGSPFL